jgi:hypothetical protein
MNKMRERDVTPQKSPGSPKSKGLIRPSRAAHTQPERHIRALDRHDDMIEVITTSQKLAHRIVHELTKQFRGRTSYAWSDDWTPFARWERGH